jgi:predicted O-methyltransferase YrrM
VAAVEVETFQAPWELERLVALHEELQPKRVLEIGAWHGGTLRFWLRPHGSKVVVIDDEMRRAADWEEWAEAAGSDLYLLQGTSQDARVVHAAATLGPYDFVFIDGDHTYDSVRADWENYSPLVVPGGVVVFHDIYERPAYGVWRLWDEITSAPGSRHMTICQNEVLPGNEGRCGIGIVWT